jgi:hypothetical protein
MSSSVNVSIRTPQNETLMAITLISKLLKVNKIDLNLEIIYDYALKERGLYYLSIKDKIFINPNGCEKIEDGGSKKFFLGYSNDLSMFGILIHEFVHCLNFQVFKEMTEDFKKTFPTTRLYLNAYSDENPTEEIAEAGTLYITNPFLLKLISKAHYDFFKKYFKSPIASTEKKFISIYNSYPIEVKEELKSKWHIVFNIEKNKFETTN